MQLTEQANRYSLGDINRRLAAQSGTPFARRRWELRIIRQILLRRLRLDMKLNYIEPSETPLDDYLAAGGCGDLALAFKAEVPTMRLAVTWVPGGMAHAVAYNPVSGLAYDAYGTHSTASDALIGFAGDEELDVHPSVIEREAQNPNLDRARTFVRATYLGD